MSSRAEQLLAELNSEYAKLHREFEEAFWIFQMGDHSIETGMNEAEKTRDLFRSDSGNLAKVQSVLAEPDLSAEHKSRLLVWENFFKLYQTPPELRLLRDEIADLESKISQKLANQSEGYENPDTKEFVPASKIKMRMMIRTDPNESIRKACFLALEGLSTAVTDEYVKVITSRNKYAQALGFEDYYAYHLSISEGMTKQVVFDLFGQIYRQTLGTFEEIRKLEESQLGLRKPWNFAYMMAGSFMNEEDPYYGFDEALRHWGRSFSALGIDFKGGTLQLDLLDRKGKYNNGFCHYPDIVSFSDGKRNPGAANFTCNVVYGQVGAGLQGMETLFHEGGHAADRLNSEQGDTCLNTEWPPASIAWAETQSQFLDTMFKSIEWRARYAKNKDGQAYPFDLFERKIRKLHLLAPHGLHHIMFVAEFEKMIYEARDLDTSRVLEIAKMMYQKYFDRDGDSLSALSVPHIYSWDSSAYYHAYGLAILALQQWREYFYERYGHIVDNPEVGREMTAVWELASAKNFAEFVRLATGKDLSSEAFLENATISVEDLLARSRKRVERLNSVPEYAGPVNLNATIRMVSGKGIVADNSVSFEDMAEKYKDWLNK